MLSGRLRSREEILDCNISFVVEEKVLIEDGCIGEGNLALRILRSHGLPESAHEVARATTLARLMYAYPAWWGFASASDRTQVERLLQRTIRMGVSSACFARFRCLSRRG